MFLIQQVLVSDTSFNNINLSYATVDKGFKYDKGNGAFWDKN